MKKLAVVALAGGMAFAAAPAYKMPTNLGWYAGVGINHYAGMTEEDSSDTWYGRTIGGTQLDSSDLGWNIFAGYRNTTHFGTELGFNWIGDNTYKGTFNDVPVKAKVKDMWNVYYDAMVYMPLACGFEAFAKAGANYFHGKGTTQGFSATTRAELSTFGMNYGAGIQYTYQQFGARVAYTDLQTLTHDQKDDNFVPNLINLDVFYNFS